jgi:hypothetical protein
MPDAKNNAKMTGDTHPPDDPAPFAPQDLKEAAVGADGTPRDRGQAAPERDDEAQPGRGINQAGFIKDKDDETSDSYGSTRDSGEKPS